MMAGYFIGTWFASVCCGVAISSQKQNALTGFFLCLFFGPIGLFACPFLDARTMCPQCKTRLSEAPNQCPSCWARFRWNKSKTQCEFLPYEFRREAQPPKPAAP